MKHYGDITKLSGYDLPVVDVIVGGSPCQDLSVAGRRAGLDGERSGLFMEQIRIVKEMRDKDVRESGRSGFMVRPRYLVWENVPGAFSSNGGEDFKTVIEEIVKIVEPIVPDLRETVQDKWTKSGCVYDEMGRWSVAWRVHDAQFWGVPQRRKRISLVADFGGLSAPEILFERKGLRWDPEPSEEKGERTAIGIEGSSGEAGFYDAYQHHGWRRSDVSGPMTVGQNVGIRGDTPLVSEPIPLEGNGQRESHKGNGYGESGDPSFTLNSVEQHGVVTSGFPLGFRAENTKVYEEVDTTVCNGTRPGYTNGVITAYGISAYESNSMKSSNPNSGIYEADTARTIDITGGSPACNQGGIAIVQAVDCRNGAESEINASLQASCDHNLNSNNVVRVSGVVTKGNGEAFLSGEKHMSLSVGGGQAGQGFPCALIEKDEPDVFAFYQDGQGNLRCDDNCTKTVQTNSNASGRGMQMIVQKNVEDTGAYNKWDVQSKHIQREEGIAESLYAGECRYGGGESYVMQSVDTE